MVNQLLPCLWRSTMLLWMHAVLCASICFTSNVLARAAVPTAAEFATSSQCAECHAREFQSWQKTYHRTMTQHATTSSVRGSFDGQLRRWMTVDWLPVSSAGTFTMQLPDPRTSQPTSYSIVRTVGSRRMQQYLTRIGDRHVRLPIAWSMEENRWFHLSEAFFHPDGESFFANLASWEANCIFCHNTGPNPGWNGTTRSNPIAPPDGTFHGTVAELGISCEACHGPAKQHVDLMKTAKAAGLIDESSHLFTSSTQSLSAPLHPQVVQPAELDSKLSTMICARCHGQRVPTEQNPITDVLAHGDPFRPGEDLQAYYTPITSATVLGTHSFAPRFWRDGSPRLTAYEYQGMLQSACYTKGAMSCQSCHSMHTGDPHGQLRPELPGNKLCTQCHTSLEPSAAVAAHTHHLPSGSGSSCVSCHMPPVVYGVMAWHPTHAIKNPDASHSAAYDMPDACTVCHVDQSRAWSVRNMEVYWPRRAQAQASSASLDSDTPEMIRALFAGDAVYRTLAAHQLGLTGSTSAAAYATSGPVATRWALPMLAQAYAQDGYTNVRRTARNSIVSLSQRVAQSSVTLPLAIAAPADRRQAAISAVRNTATGDAMPPGFARRPDGSVDHEPIVRWRRLRTEVPIAIGE